MITEVKPSTEWSHDEQRNVRTYVVLDAETGRKLAGPFATRREATRRAEICELP